VTETCALCARLATPLLLASDDLAAAFPDAFPLNPGHTLVVPRRHEPDYFALTPDEQVAMWRLVNTVKDALEARHHPQGYNVGINVGATAGQTIGHVHIHLIPRYAGDVDDPRGGVRLIIPARARYWEAGDAGH